MIVNEQNNNNNNNERMEDITNTIKSVNHFTVTAPTEYGMVTVLPLVLYIIIWVHWDNT